MSDGPSESNNITTIQQPFSSAEFYHCHVMCMYTVLGTGFVALRPVCLRNKSYIENRALSNYIRRKSHIHGCLLFFEAERGWKTSNSTRGSTDV